VTNDADRRRVAELIGREPMGRFSVVVRDDDGDPVVIENQPLLDDGTPMPTRYWLVGVTAARRVAELESTGGVRVAEAAVDEDALAAAHARYARERNALIPDDHDGPRPDGGVGGTRRGVKCLHAHYAWFLAGGDDPVGAWIHRRLHCADVHLGDRVTITTPDAAIELDTTPAELEHAHLGLHDPRRPRTSPTRSPQFAMTSTINAAPERFSRPPSPSAAKVVICSHDWKPAKMHPAPSPSIAILSKKFSDSSLPPPEQNVDPSQVSAPMTPTAF
jgi:hypothetical protein